MPKPILIRTSGLTNRVWAIRRYTERADGLLVSSAKDDVTRDAIQAVIEHARSCTDPECSCEGLREAATSNYHAVNPTHA